MSEFMMGETESFALIGRLYVENQILHRQVAMLQKQVQESKQQEGNDDEVEAQVKSPKKPKRS